jgi:hypothetical protein
MATSESNGTHGQTYDIPKECKAGVVVDEGPNFRVEVQMVPVPEIGIFHPFLYLLYLANMKYHRT